jgi:hypothetical protein
LRQQLLNVVEELLVPLAHRVHRALQAPRREVVDRLPLLEARVLVLQVLRREAEPQRLLHQRALRVELLQARPEAVRPVFRLFRVLLLPVLRPAAVAVVLRLRWL